VARRPAVQPRRDDGDGNDGWCDDWWNYRRNDGTETTGGSTTGGTTGTETTGGSTTGGTTGTETTGSATTGGETVAGETTGGTTGGTETTGSATTGGETTGTETSGGNTTGGPTSDGLAEALPGGVGPIQLVDRVLRDVLLGPPSREALTQMAIDTRTLRSVELRDVLTGREMYNDLQASGRNGVEPLKYTIAVHRLRRATAQQVLADYYRDVRRRPEGRRFEQGRRRARAKRDRQRMESLRRAAGCRSLGVGFRAYLTGAAEHADALGYLDRLDKLFRDTLKVGLTPTELTHGDEARPHADPPRRHDVAAARRRGRQPRVQARDAGEEVIRVLASPPDRPARPNSRPSRSRIIAALRHFPPAFAKRNHRAAERGVLRNLVEVDRLLTEHALERLPVARAADRQQVELAQEADDVAVGREVVFELRVEQPGSRTVKPRTLWLGK
jgi:hypothetical protein